MDVVECQPGNSVHVCGGKRGLFFSRGTFRGTSITHLWIVSLLVSYLLFVSLVRSAFAYCGTGFPESSEVKQTV